MDLVLIAAVVFGAYSVVHLLWLFLTWEIRWEMRLVRLAVHAALFGAAASALALIYFGGLRP